MSIPAVGVKLTVHGWFARMMSHCVIPRTAIPPMPCVFASEAGVVHVANGVTTLDVAAYMKLVDANTRWKDLPGNTA